MPSGSRDNARSIGMLSDGFISRPRPVKVSPGARRTPAHRANRGTRSIVARPHTAGAVKMTPSTSGTGVPFYLLGDSMGGAVAVEAMTGESGTPVPDVDGVILTAPAVWGRATMDLVPRLALWAGVRLAPGLTLTGRGLEIKPSDNIPMLRALSRDPLVIKETRVDTIYGLVDLMDAALDSAPLLP